MVRLLKSALLIISSLFIVNCEKKPLDFYSIPKIDAHSHFETNNTVFLDLAKDYNFRFLSITTHSHSRDYIDKQLEYAITLKENNKENFCFTTTFSMEGFGSPDWEKNVIEKLTGDFNNGAIAVKVWKDIGMVFRDKDSSFIMIDDHRFDKILDFIAANGKTLVAHIAEPRNCWLPVDSMTVNNDKKYFKNHPEYHMYKHPDFPSYEEIIEHRDNMLEKHPGLIVVGCHLGSLEWSTDELAKRLEKYPDFSVDLSSRICHLQGQNRDKVRDFIIKYQNRLLYGTDMQINENDDQKRAFEQALKVWLNDWEYFTTDNTMSSGNLNKPFQGLKLPNDVVRKIYFENAKKCYPGL